MSEIKNAKMRDSNMELLRIIAMLLVMIVHTGFVSLGQPSQHELQSSPGITTYRFFCQSLSIICVNLFILLSGWYGIRPQKKSFLRFLFQIAFFVLGGFFIYLSITPEKALTIESLLKLFLLLPDNWFIKAYILLYILAPFLNSFLDSATQSQKGKFIASFFVIQSIYGWLFNGMRDFEDGYTTISFIGLYMLANYVRHSQSQFFKLSRKVDILIYILISCALTILSLILCASNHSYEFLFAYNNPLVVISSLYFFLYFTKLSLQSRIINNIATSSFAIYLLHCNPFFFRQIYTSTVSKRFYEQPFGCWLIATIVFIIITATASICLDKIRILLWAKLQKTI